MSHRRELSNTLASVEGISDKLEALGIVETATGMTYIVDQEMQNV